MHLKNNLISIAIALIFVLFIGYGIEVFDPTPDYNEYFPRDLYDIQSQSECESSGGLWNEIEGENLKPVRGFCEISKEKRDSYDSLRTEHDKIVFIAAAIIGILAVIAGILLKKESVNSGIMGGGLLLILYGTIRYWDQANDILKFILLGAVLGILIWIGYKKLK